MNLYSIFFVNLLSECICVCIWSHCANLNYGLSILTFLYSPKILWIHLYVIIFVNIFVFVDIFVFGSLCEYICMWSTWWIYLCLIPLCIMASQFWHPPLFTEGINRLCLPLRLLGAILLFTDFPKSSSAFLTLSK